MMLSSRCLLGIHVAPAAGRSVVAPPSLLPRLTVGPRDTRRCSDRLAASASAGQLHSRDLHLERAPSSPWPRQPQRVTQFENLQGDDFRHPLDQQNTSMMRSIPGLEVITKGFLGPATEQVLLLENIATSLKIGPQQLPSVHKLLVEAAEVLQMELPELYVRQNPIPNAYTLAIAGRKPFIVIHTALLELLTPRELQAVLAHELGHLKCDHGLWLTIANVVASGTVTVLPVVSGLVEEALMRWLRAAELTCDRAALLVAQDARVVVAALMKLAGGSPSFANELNVDAFLEQARSYDEATNSVIGWYLRNAQTRALSHPLPVMRAREIDRWSHSSEYKGLLSRNRAHLTAVSEPEEATHGGALVAVASPAAPAGASGHADHSSGSTGSSGSSSSSTSGSLKRGNVSSSIWGGGQGPQARKEGPSGTAAAAPAARQRTSAGPTGPVKKRAAAESRSPTSQLSQLLSIIMPKF